MSKNESIGGSKDAAIMIRRLLFFVLLSLIYLSYPTIPF